MKISCPQCQSSYTIADEKLVRKTMRAACPKCTMAFFIDRDSGKVSPVPSNPTFRQLPEKASTPPQPNGPQKSLPINRPSEKTGPREQKPAPERNLRSPEYPLYWDFIGVAVILAVLAGAIWGVYYLATSPRLPHKAEQVGPMTDIKNYVKGLIDKFRGQSTEKVCQAFLHQHRVHLAKIGLGAKLKFSLVKEEFSRANNRQTAKTIMAVEGARGKTYIFFSLIRHQGQWRIVSAVMAEGKGQYRSIYPPPKAKRKVPPKALQPVRPKQPSTGRAGGVQVPFRGHAVVGAARRW
jgi:hypothetical protein